MVALTKHFIQGACEGGLGGFNHLFDGNTTPIFTVPRLVFHRFEVGELWQLVDFAHDLLELDPDLQEGVPDLQLTLDAATLSPLFLQLVPPLLLWARYWSLKQSLNRRN